ncbi:MAG: hypothetical protein L6243_07610 [Candidatus Altiarchaeales archaeon]|nr:hypothetical protein [Candidatus Altiarchaeota archaeon]MBU4341663.1 hypothetical protein [Candidatus Altiarchaeota archaeon]MBU4437848.1 hypothetical protein [Candidatus Altiarchaeota archaeon]MCG2783437.1 hypothetical protein [Candidatus Altiarchaeales archaeon]
MKKLRKEIMVCLSPVKLYPNDIKEIVEILKNEGCRDIELQTEDYELKLNELEDIDKTFINFLRIVGRQPYIMVEVGRNTHIFSTEDTTVTCGIVKKIEDVLIKNKRSFLNLVYNRWSSIVLVLSGNLLMLTSMLGGITIYNENVSVSIGVILTLIGISIMFLSFFWRPNIIILKSRREDIGFLEKNRDAIILSVLSAVFGGIVMYILTRGV